jgi:hypothetical protein
VRIESLEQMQCVIFDQAYEHEGRAFLDNKKVFLRSELIFNVCDLGHKPEIGALFSSATYFTIQSSFQPYWVQHAHELYEKVNNAHWGKEGDANIQQVQPLLLHKCWSNKLDFVTNGRDYYFPIVSGDNREHLLDVLKTYSLIVVLDYFNCQVEVGDDPQEKEVKETFRKLCSTKAVVPLGDLEGSVSEWTIKYLWRKMAERKSEKVINYFFSFFLFPFFSFFETQPNS